MIDYLEALLPPDEEQEEDAPEQYGAGRPVRGMGLALEKPGTVSAWEGPDGASAWEKSGAVSAWEGSDGVSALEGPDGGSLENRGLEPAEELERVRAAWRRAMTGRGAGPDGEYGEDAEEEMAPSPRAVPGEALEVRAAVLSAAAERARQAVSRQPTGETAEQGAEWSLGPARTGPDSTDPVRLVDAAFQRDARRYDGALGLL